MPVVTSSVANSFSIASCSRFATHFVYSSPPAALISSSASFLVSNESSGFRLHCSKMLRRRALRESNVLEDVGLIDGKDRIEYISGRDSFPSLISSANPFCCVYCELCYFIARPRDGKEAPITYICGNKIQIVVTYLEEAANEDHKIVQAKMVVGSCFGVHELSKQSEEETSFLQR